MELSNPEARKKKYYQDGGLNVIHILSDDEHDEHVGASNVSESNGDAPLLEPPVPVVNEMSKFVFRNRNEHWCIWVWDLRLETIKFNTLPTKACSSSCCSRPLCNFPKGSRWRSQENCRNSSSCVGSCFARSRVQHESSTTPGQGGLPESPWKWASFLGKVWDIYQETHRGGCDSSSVHIWCSHVVAGVNDAASDSKGLSPVLNTGVCLCKNDALWLPWVCENVCWTTSQRHPSSMRSFHPDCFRCAEDVGCAATGSYVYVVLELKHFPLIVIDLVRRTRRTSKDWRDMSIRFENLIGFRR